MEPACAMSCGSVAFASKSELHLPITCDGVALDNGYRIDLLVEDSVIVEVKAASKLLPIHEAQSLSYLKLSKRPLGLLINFNVIHLRDGIRRLAN
jgi:GxxExxY protein